MRTPRTAKSSAHGSVSTPAAGTNEQTLASYNAKIAEYVAGTPSVVAGTNREWIDSLADRLPEKARILELGSGTGRDADYLETKGFRVERTDGAQAFVDLLKSNGHRNARRLNVLSDSLGEGRYECVFANAVLLHFSAGETAAILKKAHGALKDAGVLAFSVKAGEGSVVSDEKLGAPRVFHFWKRDALRRAVERAGFKVLELTEVRSSAGSDTFLQVLAAHVPAGPGQRRHDGE